MKIYLKLVCVCFALIFSLFFVIKSKVYAAAIGEETSAICTPLGTTRSCPTIGSFTRTDGSGEIWPAQAVPCECVAGASGNNRGVWTTCDYPSAEFVDYKGSCANDNLYSRQCSFTAQSIACTSSSVSVKYTCGSWVKETCGCSAGAVEYKPKGECGTSTRTCCGGVSWSEWDEACPSCSSSQCWNGSTCVNKEAVSRSCSGNVANAAGGTQTRTATCTNGSGWSYGSWTGTCTCNTGYSWSSSSNKCLKGGCDTSGMEWCNDCGLTFNLSTCKCSCPAGSSWNGNWCVTTAGLIYSCR